MSELVVPFYVGIFAFTVWMFTVTGMLGKCVVQLTRIATALEKRNDR